MFHITKVTGKDLLKSTYTDEMLGLFDLLEEETYVFTKEKIKNKPRPEKSKLDSIKKDSFYYIAVQESVLVGFVECTNIKANKRMPAMTHISAVIVEKESRGLGIASQLMERCISDERRQGNLLHLNCVSNNKAALKLYTSCGFTTFSHSLVCQ